MKFGLSVAFLLLLGTVTVTVKGTGLSDFQDGYGPSWGETLQRSKRGLRIYDLVRGITTTGPKSPKPAGGNGIGFDLSDALNPGPQSPKPAGGNDDQFQLEDALSPDSKPFDKSNGRECQAVAQQLSKIIENQKQQFSILAKLMARLNIKPM